MFRFGRAARRVNGLRILHTPNSQIDQLLRSDIKQLGKILGSSIKNHDPKVYDTVEDLRRLGREWRLPGGDAKAFDQMVSKIKKCDAMMLHGVSRSFANFLALANSAENHHRIRRLKNSLISSNSEYGLWSKKDSCAGTIKNLINDKGIEPDTIFEALTTQKVEIVLTAHPTEVNRRTMLRKLHNIKQILDKSDHPDLTQYERNQLKTQLTAEVSSIWGSDFLRRSKPSPIKEAKSGLAVVETVLWNAIPSFLRKLDDVAKGELKRSLPLNISPIQMATWMGGDRDGNPNVTPAVTLEVCMLSRWVGATLFKADITTLIGSLSVDYCSEELREATNSKREPYREILKPLEARLQATVEWAESYLLDSKQINRDIRAKHAEPLKSTRELMEPLLLIHRSLTETGLEAVADGALVDTIRRLAVFGLTMMPLDIRQESTRHSEALDAITRYLGIGSYMKWDEDTRRTWLLSELGNKRPLLPRKIRMDNYPNYFTPSVIDTLRTFEVAALQDEGSLGAYVISQCQQASDVLAVMLLQQQEVADTGSSSSNSNGLLRVVPLFETLDDLQRAADTVDALFHMDVYRNLIQGKQEIMVGYSDSAKDAGRLAASWAQYKAQVAMTEVAQRHGNIELTFFHGKGGTVGRGGNPALFEAILAHPPGTIQGRFRVTEQGEMITQNLGQEAVAERTLDLFTAGVLSEQFLQRPVVKQSWIDAMERMSVVSCNAYRDIVRGEPRFVPYFRSATPELELAGLNVGSRPSKRNPQGGVESLRAIPWVFAWTQTRLNLPTWLGVGEAFQHELQQHPEVLKDMYTNWPWFHTLVDLLEMILVKSDSAIAANYDKQLVTDADSIALGAELRNKMQMTAETLLTVTGNPQLQANNSLLLSSLAVRNPYVDPLNIIQAEILARLRADEDAGGNISNNTTTTRLSQDERLLLKDALLITINGIANGMRNSG